MVRRGGACGPKSTLKKTLSNSRSAFTSTNPRNLDQEGHVRVEGLERVWGFGFWGLGSARTTRQSQTRSLGRISTLRFS